MQKYLFLLIGLALSAVNVAHAATGVTIDKPKVLFRLSPGEAVTGNVGVFNPDTSETLQVRVTQNDWLLSPEGTPQYFSPGSLKTSLSSWLSLNATAFPLAAGKGTSVRYTLQVPPGTPEGMYWGLLLFNGQAAAPDAQSKPGTGVAMQFTVNVAHIIYVQVGATKLEGRISGMKTSVDSGKLKVSTTLRNTGNTYIGLSGRVELRNQKGELVAQKDVDNSLVLPGFSRTYDTVFDKTLPPGKYLALAALEYQKGKFYTGEVQVEVK